MAGYVFDHAWEQERDRLGGLEWALDPGTVRHLDALGVGPGWRCLEAGAGGGSVAGWLAGRVTPGGRVVAVDVDTRFLEPLAGDTPGLEVLRHDLLSGPVAGAFDLAHARWLLHWLGDPQAGIDALAGAVRPGGWVIVEEPDGAAFLHGSEPGVFRRVATAWLDVLVTMAGVHLDLGRALPRRLREAGLVDVDGEGRLPVLTGGSPLARFLGLSIEKVRAGVAAGGAVTESEVDEVLALLDDASFSTVFVATVAAWGRRR